MVARYPSIPDPTSDPVALRSTALTLKETVEILTRQRGDRTISAVTWQDLVDLGLILPSQIPVGPGNK